MDALIKQFNKLTSGQQLQLLKVLETSIAGETKLLSYRPMTEKPTCFYCESPNTIKFGTYSKQAKTRYRCIDCKKTFSGFTGTAIYNVKKKHLWMSFIKLMLENKSIRDIAKQLKLSTTTVFHWRHRVLSSFDKTFTKDFKGIVETDDIFLKFNQKGRKRGYRRIDKKKRGISDNQVAVMVMADRYKTLDMKVTKLGRINVGDLHRVINVSRLNENNIICSDMHPTIERFVKTLNLQHFQIKASAGQYVKDGIYHVQKVNSLASEFKRWLNKNFINVSTKYLQNYLNWFEMNQILKNEEKIEPFVEYSMQDDLTYYRKKSIEARYNKLLEW